MIREIINILASDNFYNESEVIEIEKGRYKLPMTFKGMVKNIKRQVKWQSKEK